MKGFGYVLLILAFLLFVLGSILSAVTNGHKQERRTSAVREQFAARRELGLQRDSPF